MRASPNVAGAAFLILLATASPVGAEPPALSGFVQVDYLHSQESADQLGDGDGEPLNRDRFLVRRARLRASGAEGAIAYVVEADFNTVEGARAGLRETEVSLVADAPERWNLGTRVTGRIGAGVIRSPFGYEVYEQRDTERLFAERSQVSQALFPGVFDLGARASIEAPFAELVIAVVNGEPLGSRGFPARDPNAAKDVIGRVSLRGLLGGVALSGGFAATVGRGFHPGSPPTKDTLVWRDLNEDGIVQLGEIQVIPGSAGTPSENFDRWGAEVDLQLGLEVAGIGRMNVYAEASLASNLDRGLRQADPVLLGRDQRSVGGYLAVTQGIGGRGAFGVRVDHYRPEIDRTDLQGGEIVRSRESFTSVGAAAAFRFRAGETGARLVLDYTHRRDPLGRDETGRPTDLANDELTARLEAVF